MQSSPGKWDLPMNHCFFGVPQDESYGWTVLQAVPDEVRGFYFYLGGEPEELLSDFSASQYPAKLEILAIGNSSFSRGKSLDYRALIQAIGVARFPKLRQLELGVWELFSNSHCMYGELGDVTKILSNSPMVEVLGLYGSFGITDALNFACLRDLTVTLEDDTTGVNGGFIEQTTLSHLLNSEFPNLEEAFLDLICEDDEYGYKFPETFLTGANLPKLKKLEICGGFAAQEKERLLASALGKKAGLILHHDDMVVS
ncbi:MAG: hypothetical protein HQ519_02440 [Planctomycetes bacterium]|nr:hypothetical protein [Planctomycetota bacterium]